MKPSIFLALRDDQDSGCDESQTTADVLGRARVGEVPERDIAFVVLVATSNRLAEFRLLAPELLRILAFAKVGHFRNVGIQHGLAD
jgi:hypothetical protein